MKKVQTIMVLIILHTCIFAKQTQNEERSIKSHNLLIYTEVDSPNHEHKITGKATDTIEELLKKEKFTVEIKDDSRLFTETDLKQFDAVIFLNTRGDVLNEREGYAFQKFIRAGRGAAVIHAAMLTEEDWDWFENLVGTQFKDHPKIQPGKIINAAPDHELNQGLPKSWIHTDEWYNYTKLPQDVTTLLNVDESTYEGGIHGEPHPVSWYHNYDGGRIFYTALGHTEECWSNQYFLKHILNGIRYAAGIDGMMGD